MIGILTAIVGPIMGVVDKFVEDKDKAKEIEAEILRQMLDQNSDLVKAQSAIITAEAQGEGWLQRSWRPVTMLSFLALMFSYWLGFAPAYVIDNPDLVGRLFSLLEIGIGGYIASRGVEKVAATVANAGGVKKMLAG